MAAFKPEKLTSVFRSGETAALMMDVASLCEPMVG